MKQQSGFTLIEVLVASAIIIMSIGVLLQLFSSNLERNKRIAMQAHLLTAQRSLVAKLDQINPAKQKKGSGVLEGLSYSWAVRQIAPYKKIYEPESFIPREIALFEINIKIDKPQKGIYQLDVQQLGWRAEK